MIVAMEQEKEEVSVVHYTITPKPTPFSHNTATTSPFKHILHAVLYTFPKVLTRRIYFLYSHDLNVFFRGDIVRGI